MNRDRLKGKNEPNTFKVIVRSFDTPGEPEDFQVARKAAEPEKQWGLGKMMKSFEQDLDSLKIES